MSLVKLAIKGISYSQTQHGAYALVLKEIDGEINLPIVIGAFEAQSIAIAIEGEIKPPRPLTHDLFKNFADVFGITLKQVIIHKLADGVFYSSIICERDKIEEIIDARTSDAIALALRFDTPIFTYRNILDKAGIFLNKTNDPMDDSLMNPDIAVESQSDEIQDEFFNHDLKELERLLNEAVLNEDYERAAKIRDAINKL
jgi:bifunctional DNase/RNase